MMTEVPPAEEVPFHEVRGRPRWPDVLGVLWVIVAACVTLVPALVHGRYIGPFDFNSALGLTAQPHVIIHNGAIGDISDEVVPWAQAAWTQVHQGHVPLWIHDEGIGMPLAFNFGSAAFSLPALVSYIFPLGAVLWVQILVSLVVGGTGAYFLGRVLRLHPVACALAGTTWVLSGPFFGYLGLPDTSVMSWAGWQFAAVVLIVRGRHRLCSVALLAVSLAFSIYAGNPQIEVVILLALCVFVVVVLLRRVLAPRSQQPIRKPITDLAIASVAGVALAAPLALPGLQLATASIRNLNSSILVNPHAQVLGIIFQSFWGQPFPGAFVSIWGYFPEQWVYVGAIALALSVAAVAVRWRRPEVIGLATATAVCVAASIFRPFNEALNDIPLVGHTWWGRALIPLAFCLAILAGIGLDAVICDSERRRATRWALGAFGAIAVLLGLIWLFGRGNLAPGAAHVREKSFIWPVASTAIGLAIFAGLALINRSSISKHWNRRSIRLLMVGMAGLILTSQTVLLIIADSVIPSSSSAMYKPTSGVTALQHAVGSALVGLGHSKGGFGGVGLGLAPNTNVPFGIDEFAEYDPIAPSTFFTKWTAINGTSNGLQSVYDFAPTINSATVARRYGISYVLEPRGAAGPSGGVFEARVGNEDLYRIPGAAIATLVPESSSSAWPSTDAAGKAVPVDWPGPSAVRVVTNASSPQVLRLRVASIPGWQATIDGRPLALTPYLSMMLQAKIPPGKHTIELHYWPNRFTEGLVIAAIAVVGFATAAVVVRRRDKVARVEQERPT